MVTEPNTMMAAIVTAVSTAVPYLMGFELYIPYFIGGAALFAWMVANQEAIFALKDASIIIACTFCIGFLTKGLILPISEVIYGIVIINIPKEVVVQSTSLQSGSVVNSLANIISFTLGGLARTIFNRFFSSRKDIVNKLAREIEEKV